MKTAEYILFAAKDAETDQKLWCRYLRKCFVDGKPIITRAEIDRALTLLPEDQAAIVREIMDPESDLYEHVRKLNMPVELTIVNELKQKLGK